MIAEALHLLFVAVAAGGLGFMVAAWVTAGSREDAFRAGYRLGAAHTAASAAGEAEIAAEIEADLTSYGGTS